VAGLADSGLQLVLVADREMHGRLGALPPNVVVVPRTPQHTLLEKASVFVTHGGLSSVKEAIWFGVPMLVFPLGYDQHGNAARIAFHGLGARGDERYVTPESVGALWA